MLKKPVIPVEWLEQQVAEIEEALQHLQARRDVFLDLLEKAPRVAEPISASHAGDDGGSAKKDGLEPSTAIDELVANEPGLTRKQVADRVENIVASEAKNVRAVLFTHMRRREQAEEFFKDEQGRLYPKHHPKAVAARNDERNDREKSPAIRIEKANSGGKALKDSG